jgi:hypothetical protein
MPFRALLAGAVILSVSCNKSEGGDGFGGALTTAAGSARSAGSGGSFSAELATDLGAGSSAKAAAADGKAGSDGAAAGGDAKPASGGDAKLASGGDAKSTAGDGKPAGAAGDGKAGDGSDKPDLAQATVAAAVPPRAAGGHGPVKVPADLAAIKLSLLPNWDRDVGEPGTIQYVVRIKGTQNTKTFTFRYGYDDPKAPSDRDQYKKYLQDTGSLMGDIRDRQRGAAWFLEGSDAAGLPAFRYVVLYGGKRLICYGSLYKDPEASRLGDDRDQTLIQAKQICETLAL